LIHRTNLVLQEVIFELAPLIKSGNLPRILRTTARQHITAKERRLTASLTGRCNSEIYRLIRAAGRPYFGAFTWCENKKLITWRGKPAQYQEVSKTSLPGNCSGNRRK